MCWDKSNLKLGKDVTKVDIIILSKNNISTWLVVKKKQSWKIWKSVGMIIRSIWENKKCLKPPISYWWMIEMKKWGRVNAWPSKSDWMIKKKRTTRILVGGFNPSEKIWKSLGMILPNIWENNPVMFQTTNQNIISIIIYWPF
jgi:hypothetical protein